MHRLTSSLRIFFCLSASGMALCAAASWAAGEAPNYSAIKMTRTIMLEAPATTVAFSPDDQLVAIGAQAKVLVYDAKDELKHTLPGPAGGVGAITFSADGKTLASGGAGDSVALWDAATGKEAGNLSGHQAAILSLAFSADAKSLAGGARDGQIVIWDLKQMEAAQVLKGAVAPVTNLAFTEDGKSLVSLGFGQKGGRDITEWRVWDLASGEAKQQMAPALKSHCMALSGNARLLARGGDLSLNVSDALTGTPITNFAVTEQNAKRGDIKRSYNSLSAALSQDGSVVANVDEAGFLRLWDVKNQTYLARFPLGQTTVLAFSPSGRSLAATAKTMSMKPGQPVPEETTVVRIFTVP